VAPAPYQAAFVGPSKRDLSSTVLMFSVLSTSPSHHASVWICLSHQSFLAFWTNMSPCCLLVLSLRSEASSAAHQLVPLIPESHQSFLEARECGTCWERVNGSISATYGAVAVAPSSCQAAFVGPS